MHIYVTKEVSQRSRFRPCAITYFNVLAQELVFNLSTSCKLNVNNIGTKYVRIMKQTAF